LAECPKCGAKVRKDKLRRHINAVHGDQPRSSKTSKAAVVAAGSTVVFPWKVVAVLAAIALVTGGGYYLVTRTPAGGGGGTPPKVAIVTTNYGVIKITLDTGRAPITAGHFISLANAGKYNNNGFQRVAKDWVIQGGRGADTANVNWEFSGLLNSKYSVAMARSGQQTDFASRNTATCEFFINLGDHPSLDSQYAYVVFGHVTEGQSVVDIIGSYYPNTPPNYDGAPTVTISISTITIVG